ncbi:caspase family protein [Streptomyces sp. GMY02]|uniref:HD domain-containing protein n=1 Tax=Streptomyces sp. GMY02 TaxID=1333528 RepID=UPI001C2C367B|nr:caspase family protein [Streptomyces sp. GMY02]QXE36266.1 caspase family protein [Streptomyces sp. GMY02]
MPPSYRSSPSPRSGPSSRPRHKALLIGASEYDEPAIRSLPFIRDDLQRMNTALSERGFQPVEIAESQRGITPNAVNRHVLRFLREAGRGDTLFILLSGHGLHFEGRDYLIPEDAYYEGGSFADSCIEIGWQKELEDSPAGQVVFLIDACREGAARRAKAAPPRMPGWEKPKIAAALRRKVAYIYACSKGQYALYVDESEAVVQSEDAHGTDTGIGTQPGDSFSLFSRAVSDIVTGVQHTLHIGEFAEAVQQRVTELHTAYGKKPPVQQIRVETDIPWPEFTVLPGPARDSSEHPWVRSTATHPVWERTAPGNARDALKEVCGTLAARLADGYEKAAAALRDDPWHDGELAKRAQDRLGFLTDKLAPGTQLSPSEAALAVLLPLVGQAFWTHEAAQRAGVVTGGPAADGSPRTRTRAGAGAGAAAGAEAEETTPERDRFAKFAQGFPRLQRRLRTLEQRGVSDGSVERIRWWLFHRWLIRQPELYASQTLKTLLGPPPGDPECPAWAADVLSGERFMRFLQELRAAPFAVPRRTPRPGDHDESDHDLVAATTRDEHELREPLVASLAKTAQAFAVDPLDLPEILVEHIGISDSVKLTDLLTTIRGSNWPNSGLGRSLKALCEHPAVQIALREHAQRVDALLRDINRSPAPALAPLRSLPPYADADRVRLSGNTPAHLSDGIRFQLAEDRVQELLMGEELYGERELAIRELYQNALDAVRYRDRRTEYLRRSGQRPEERFDGLIEFLQSVDDQGRPYLECRDNGIGMGINELSNVFSQGGARFVDLPEYIEEQTAWAELGEPRIELHPNSRFGIGVLSYFMLADEIEVTTCRMGRDGRPGRRLQVKIAGPGNLFRIEDLGQGTEPGTTVRLLLTEHVERVSCVDTLQRVLWLAPYRTTAEHGSRRYGWDPGQLSISGPELAWLNDAEMFSLSGASFPSDHPDVWWVDGTGWLLSDGLLAAASNGHEPYGALVNLGGEHQPELSVDRKTIRALDSAYVDGLMDEALPSLFSTARPLLRPDWLERVSAFSIRFADAVAERAQTSEVPWPMGDDLRPFAELGFFRPDTALLPLVTGRYPAAREAHAASYVSTIPAPVLRWRLLTLYRAGLGDPLTPAAESAPELPCARPSDILLLIERGSSSNWASEYKSWLEGVNGLMKYGKRPSEFVLNSGILSLNALHEWRDPGEPVAFDEILPLVRVTRLGVGAVAERLTALGYSVAPLPEHSERIQPDDLPLLSTLGQPGWIEPGGELSVAQVFYSAALADCASRKAADRLKELGFTVPAEFSAYEDINAWTPEERDILVSLWNFHAERLSPEQHRVVSYPQLISVARSCGATTDTVMGLLTRMGFVLSEECESRRGAPFRASQEDEWDVLSYNDIELAVDRKVPVPHLAGVTYRTGRTLRAVAEQLRALGLEVPELPLDRPLPNKQDLNFLHERYVITSNDAWPDEEKPLSLQDIAERAHHSNLSMTEAAARLRALGYDCPQEASLLDSFQEQDTEVLRWDRPGKVTAVQLYAVADHVGLGPAEVAEWLTPFGYEVEPESEAVRRDWNAQDLLGAVLAGARETRLSEHSEMAGTKVSLPTLASVAMHQRLPFRTVALKATELGLRHEAEEWFVADEPEEKTAEAEAPGVVAAGTEADGVEAAEAEAAGTEAASAETPGAEADGAQPED